MALPQFYDYKGYVIVVKSASLRRNGTLAASVNVIDQLTNRLAFKATSLAHAMRWVDAYRDGVHWAISERVAS